VHDITRQHCHRLPHINTSSTRILEQRGHNTIPLHRSGHYIIIILTPPALAEEPENSPHWTPFRPLLSLLFHKFLQVEILPASRDINILYLLEVRLVPKPKDEEEDQDDDDREVRLEERSHACARTHLGVADWIETDPELRSEDLSPSTSASPAHTRGGR
jgi:hypothetical protein